MRLLRPLALVLILFVASVSNAQTDAPDASEQKYRDIRTLLGILNVGPAMSQRMLDQIDQERSVKDSEVPAAFWDEFEKEALASSKEFVERMIPTYDAQFTHAEIKSLIKIYQDPAMVKLMKVNGAIAEAEGKVEEAWANEAGIRVATRLEGEPAKAAQKKPAKK